MSELSLLEAPRTTSVVIPTDSAEDTDPQAPQLPCSTDVLTDPHLASAFAGYMRSALAQDSAHLELLSKESGTPVEILQEGHRQWRERGCPDPVEILRKYGRASDPR